MSIKYKGSCKYQLVSDYDHRIDLPVYRSDYCGRFIAFYPKGISLHPGYACDGPSGPTIDTKTFMRGAFVHDALYQMIRAGILHADFRKKADQELLCICLEDGMNVIRAYVVYFMVRLFGAKAASKENIKKVQTAP